MLAFNDWAEEHRGRVAVEAAFWNVWVIEIDGPTDYTGLEIDPGR